MDNTLMKYAFIITILVMTISCTKKKQQSLFIILENEKQGFIDSTGKVVIQPKFEWVGNFYNGLAMAGNDSSYGYIDQKGELVVPFKFLLFPGPLELYSLKERSVDNEVMLSINEFSFSNGLALFADTTKDRYGYINTKGQVVIEPKFWNATRFKDGHAVVMTSNDKANLENIRLGVINTKGEMVIPDKYYKLSRLSDNYLTATLATKKDDEYNLSSFILNYKGNVVNSVLPGQIGYFGEFSNGYSRGCNTALHSLTGSGYFIYDSTGKILKNPNSGNILYYEDIRINNGRYFWYKIEKKYSWFKIDNGNVIEVDTRNYDAIRGGFDANGIACVKYTDPTSERSLYGYIDTSGNFIIEPKFDNASNFRSGLAWASLKSGYLSIIGYINKNGVFVWSIENRKTEDNN